MYHDMAIYRYIVVSLTVDNVRRQTPTTTDGSVRRAQATTMTAGSVRR